jgi:hypothetical protein
MKPIEQPQDIGQSDIILIIAILVEFFQLIAMGPNIDELTAVVNFLAKFASIDLIKLYGFHDGLIWIMVISSLVISGLAMIFAMWHFATRKMTFHTEGGVAVMKSLFDTFLPFVITILFLPTISI